MTCSFLFPKKGRNAKRTSDTLTLDMSIDWTAIRNEYITTDTSYRKLGDKYGIGFTKIQRRATREQWPKLRSQKEVKTVSKVIEKASEADANKAVTIDHVADLILQAIEKDVIRLSEQGVPINWKNYSGALKDIKDIKTVEGMADSSLKIVFEGMESWDK